MVVFLFPMSRLLEVGFIPVSASEILSKLVVRCYDNTTLFEEDDKCYSLMELIGIVVGK